MRSISVLGMVVAAAALAGCNDSSSGPTVAAPPPSASMSLPSNAACSNEITRYQTIVKADLDTGNVEQKVYDQIQSEMAEAAKACSAGKGREAHGLVASSKARHGYRA